MSENMQAKIAKLLAKAEATDNPHEAETFTEAAERLMVKWGIEEALVRSKMGETAKREEIVRESLEYTGRYAGVWVVLANEVVGGLGGVRLYQKSKRGSTNKTAVIVGYESDVSRARMLVTSLQLQASMALATWWKNFTAKQWMTDQQKFKARRQFIVSFAIVVRDRLVALRTEEVAAAGNGAELVLVDRDAQLDAWMRKHLGQTRKGRSFQGSWHGREEGQAAGRSAGLGQPGVDRGGRAALE